LPREEVELDVFEVPRPAVLVAVNREPPGRRGEGVVFEEVEEVALEPGRQVRRVVVPVQDLEG
jgi:hypothetical protein